jgi:predicted dehydrogenase
MQKIRILIVGCGHMGYSHAKAYHRIAEFDIVGLVSLESEDRSALSRELGGIPEFDNFDEALKATCPDAVSINTYPDTHAEYALRSIAAGAHVFVEKPLARTVEDAEKVVVAADRNKKKVVVGYILRHHPSWIKFVEIAGKLGKPLVMRMNLNQQSYGEMWFSHKKLLNCLSPIVDCGVHYVDIMCLMTKAKPVSVHAVGARLSSEIKPDMYNYGQLQVTFADGSVGWYEAGWGPMMSETAFFIKDVIGPEGCVSIVSGENKNSADIDTHTRTNLLRVHHASLGTNGRFLREDDLVDMENEPGHQELCDREQRFFLEAIKENIDLAEHLRDAVNSMKIVLAADQSVRTGKVIEL